MAQTDTAAPTKATSPWLDGAPLVDYPPLEGDHRTEVAIVGAGIAGITAALLLAEAGRDVTVLEMDRVCGGATGHTTAKVSSQHGLIYDSLVSSIGTEKAQVYADANEAALAWIAAAVAERGIECHFRRRAAYAYVLSQKQRDSVEQEVDAAAKLGLPARLVEETPLPYPVEAAVRFDNQAEFDAYRYVVALAAAAAAAGAKIHEHTRATGMHEGSPLRVETPLGHVNADHVILASHFPFADRSLVFARVSPERSYSIGVTTGSEPPDGMFISAEGPTRSIRSTPHPDGELLMVGGEGHKVGQGGDTRKRYRSLEDFAHEHFDVKAVEYRWSTQDMQPADGVPYVGKVTPLSRRATMATGFAKWGMTNGTVAARLLADEVLGHDNPWAETFNSNRIRPKASAKKLLAANANVGLRFFYDRVSKPGLRRSEDLAPGEGGIVRHKGQKVAAYRDDAGKLHAVSPVCTHLYCQVNWNPAEKSWDCPCHGSRFAVDGTVKEGPAVKDLERRA